MVYLLVFAFIIALWTAYLLKKHVVKVPNEVSVWSDVIIIDSEKTLKRCLEMTNTKSIEELADHYRKFNIFIIDRRCK